MLSSTALETWLFSPTEHPEWPSSSEKVSHVILEKSQKVLQSLFYIFLNKDFPKVQMQSGC